MKGVILAGGTGTRLRPITHTGPKQLVPIANKPVLEYALEDLREAGIEEIGIVLGNKGRRAIQRHFGDGSRWDVDLTYIVQGDPLGLAHAVGCTRDFVGNDSFVVYLGDNLMRDGIRSLVANFDSHAAAASIGLQRVGEPSRYGIVALNADGTVAKLVEKPDDPPSDLALIGVYVFTPTIFDQIETLTPSWRGEYEITEAIQGLIEAGHAVRSHVVEGWWKDTGKPEDVLHANRLVLDGLDPTMEGTIHSDAQVTGRVDVGVQTEIETGAVVRGPVSIGDRTVIGSDAYLGPFTSVGDDCVVDQVHLESSVVLGNNEITAERRIVDSLIGRGASVTATEDTKPAGARLVIGEHSSVEL